MSGSDFSLSVPPELVEAIAEQVAAKLAEQAPAGPVTARNGTQTPSTGPLALRKDDAAQRLGMSVDTFERHVQPELRVVRQGRLVLIPVAELGAWLERHAARTLRDGSG